MMAEPIENYYDYELGDWVTDHSRYHAVADEPRFSALEEPVEISPELTWALILELLAAVPEDVTSMVGLGPLDTFVRWHGAAFVEELERGARDNPRFREAVLNVDLPRGYLPAEVEARLVAAFGPCFQLGPPWESVLDDPDPA
jgi:hypothetical protein